MGSTTPNPAHCPRDDHEALESPATKGIRLGAPGRQLQLCSSRPQLNSGAVPVGIWVASVATLSQQKRSAHCHLEAPEQQVIKPAIHLNAPIDVETLQNKITLSESCLHCRLVFGW